MVKNLDQYNYTKMAKNSNALTECQANLVYNVNAIY